MTVFGIGVSYGLATLFAMFSGMPIAFALGAVAVVFMGIYMPAASLDTVTQNVYEEMASITLLSIPLFILKGAAIGKSRAGQDLYSALHAWLHRVPGGLGVANVFACALFAAMAGSSPATCSAIGSAGIPEMRKRGYSPGFAAGIIAAGGTLGILPPLKAAGFDLIWFGVLMTIVMEMGLIHPPVGLNIFVIKNIAPDIPLNDIIWGVLPFVVLMLLAVVLICVFPGIATAFPDAIMGAVAVKP